MLRPVLSVLGLLSALASLPSHAEDRPHPLMRDFIGLNVHTVQFKTELYAPVTKVLRNYHPMRWDVEKDPSVKLDLPWAKNKVHWTGLYGGWKKAGYHTHASILFDDMEPALWKNVEPDAERYGRTFASVFGPSAKEPVLEGAEIGNEPGKYDDAMYEKLFVAMARGMREGDPKFQIITCAANLGKSGRYSKSIDLFAKHPDLWDVLNIHMYAETTGWPTWLRSYPEDPATKWIENIQHVLTWRAQNAPKKELWVTEFGYDSTTKPNKTTGDFAKWIGSTDEQQAMWNLRSFLVLARLGVDRAHLYFFNDSDEPQLHGSSGITRNFTPKPSFHALAWLQSSLGDYRFSRVEREDAGECYAYEFVHGTDPKKRVWAVWRVTGDPKTVRLLHDPLKVIRAERMPLTAGPAEKVEVKEEIEGYFSFEATTHPVFVWLETK